MSSKNIHNSQLLEVTPDPTLFGKLGARSKALPNVVTELVDNSLDSWTLMPGSLKKGKTLEVRIIAGSIEGSAFTVTDNAGGMTREELQGAMTIAKSEKGKLSSEKKLLGFYGFGLKSAAMFIGDQFSVYSQSFTEKNQVHYVEFDRETFEDANSKTKWKLEFKTVTADQAAKMEIHFPNGHGTLIRIKNKRYRPASQYGIVDRLRRTFAPRLPCDPRMKSLNEKFSYEPMHIYFITRESQASKAEPLKALGAFYTYWDNDKAGVKEYYEQRLRELKNCKDQDRRRTLIDELAVTDPIKGHQKDERGAPLESILPALNWIEESPGWKEIKSTIIAEKTLRGRVALLDRGMAHTSEYGFDLIKNGRVIETFVKDPEKKREQFVGLVANNHNARIIGQLFLDEWPTDHQKTEFIKEVAGWSKAEEETPEGKKKAVCVADLVHDFIKDQGFISASYAMQSPRAAIPGGRSQQLHEESITRGKVSEASPAIASNLSRMARSENVTEQLKKIDKAASSSIKKDLKKLEDETPTASSKLQYTKPELEWGNKGRKTPLYSVRAQEDKKFRRLIVTLNLDHPFLEKKETGQIKVVGAIIAAEAFAAYMAKEKLILGSGFDHYLALRDDLLRESS